MRRLRKRRWITVGLAGLSLSGCASQPGPALAPQIVTRLQCLPMVSYSKEEQAQAADELSKLPAGSMLARFVVDYGAMRSADRACQGAQ